MFIDTHTHIYLKDFKEDLSNVISRCKLSRVGKLLMPNIDVWTIDNVKELSELYPDLCLPMMGLHPCSVKEDYIKQMALIERELFDNQYIAVGEIGIDLHWDKTFKGEQKDVFKKQIEWALELNLPIVIHSRDSLDLTIQIVEDMQNGKLRGVFHCFNGTIEQGQKIKELGFYIGIGGVITFKNAGVDQVVKELDLSTMILETDAPYLSPVPYRGKRNESSYIPIIGQRLAELKGLTLKEIEVSTTDNANNLFELDNKV